jgi:hypothetical protein
MYSILMTRWEHSDGNYVYNVILNNGPGMDQLSACKGN